MPKLNVKLSNGSSVEVSVESISEGTVFDLKKALSGAIDIPAESQRVVYKGRILKDGDALTTVGLLDGVALHVVRSAGGAAASTSNTATTTASTNVPTPAQAPVQQPQQTHTTPVPNANPFASLFGGAGANNNNTNNFNPQPAANFGNANPFASMMGGGGLGGFGGMGGGGVNPNQMAAAAQMMQNNPQMQQMMQQLMQNPQMMRQVLQMDPNISNMPEPQRSQTLDLLTNPIMLQGMMGAMGGGGMGGMGGAGGMMMGQPPQQQQQGGAPNPFASMMGGGFGGGAGGGLPLPPPVPQMSTEQARTQFAAQLQQLQSMGFPNEDANIRALIMSQGNVDFAVARLLGD